MATYTSTTTGGNWSAAGTWTTTPPAGGPGSGDTVVIASGATVTVDSAAGPSANGVVVVGNAGPSAPTAAPAFAATGGGTATPLPTGVYRCCFTYVDGSGRESAPSPESGGVSLTNVSSTPLVTFPSSTSWPPGVVSMNLYLTNTNGGVLYEHLYATGIVGTTYNPASASWTNGTATYAAATSLNAIGTGITCQPNGSGQTALKLSPGTSLTVKGDVLLRAAAGYTSTLTLNAGSSLTLYPASGVQYKVDCTDLAGSTPTIVINGTQAGPCTLAVNTLAGGLGGYIAQFSTNRTQAVVTANWCNFSNWGTSTQYGVTSHTDPGSTAVSITNCSFTGCNYAAYLAESNSTWDGDFTFANNTFASSVLGPNNTCFYLGAQKAASSGYHDVTGNAFDAAVFITPTGEQIQYNIFGNGIITSGTTKKGWFFDSNVVFGDGGTTGLILAATTITNNYWISSATTHPSGASLNDCAAAVLVSGNIFEAPNTAGGGGHILVPSGNASTAYAWTVIGNIGVPSAANGSTPGCLITPCLGSGLMAITAEHNTWAVQNGQGGIVELGDYLSGAPAAGRIASVRANIDWSPIATANNGCWVSFNQNAAVTDEITTCGHNCHQNAVTATIVCGNGSYTLYGYSNASTYNEQISSNGPLPNSQMGQGDLSGSVNPQFADPTRNFGVWGTRTQGVSAGSDVGLSETLAYLGAAPSSLSARIPALLSWVRAGFAPQNRALLAASYPGDASAADAAGNPWPGGAPGIGAMAVVPVGISYPRGISSLRPTALPTVSLHGYLD